MPDPAQLTDTLLRSLWPSFKRRLELKFPGEPWIRPMFLLRAMRADSKAVHLLASLPANGRIIREALNRLPLMREMLAPSFCLSLTVYPDNYQVEEARRRFGIEMLPKRRNRKS